MKNASLALRNEAFVLFDPANSAFISKESGITMANVELRPGESQEQLLKRFRKEVTKSRVLSTARKKRWFTPPSEVRRIKKQKAIRKARQAQRKRERTDY